LRTLLAAMVATIAIAPPMATAQTSIAHLLDPDAIRGIPVPGPFTIDPPAFAAYGALLVGAMLTLLYLYRGRMFIACWVGTWLLAAGALGIVAQRHGDPAVSRLLTGVAMLLTVAAAGLVLLAARAFPQQGIHWRTTIKWIGLAAAWFLVSPFVLPASVTVGTGVLAAACLLGWSGVRYLGIAKRMRHTGAVLVGAGLLLIALANPSVGAATLMVDASTAAAVSRLAAFNVITGMFVALGMHLLVVEDMIGELRRTNSELGAAHDEVKRLAITDALTGCHNRRFFDEVERREIQRHRRYAWPMSVLFADVNHFKRLNDSLGHDRGDDVLRIIGALLRRQVRESDYVIRWGGDEFLLMMTCTEAEARAKAAELKAAFDRERTAAGIPDYLGLSIGVAAVPRAADTLRDAIRNADSRMYRDKLSVRGQAVL
jgi:diguanylate cyclase (GGDEF)-like protein